MKPTKPLLALFLALALCFSILALPASAEDEPPAEEPAAVNWDDFYFTVQPESQEGAYGTKFTLTAEVHLPEGVTQVYYSWSPSGGLLPSSQTFVVAPRDEHYPGIWFQSGSGRFHCQVRAYGEDGTARYFTSEDATITVTSWFPNWENMKDRYRSSDWYRNRQKFMSRFIDNALFAALFASVIGIAPMTLIVSLFGKSLLYGLLAVPLLPVGLLLFPFIFTGAFLYFMIAAR